MPSDPAVNAGADPFYDPRDRPGPLPKRSADAEPLTPGAPPETEEERGASEPFLPDEGRGERP
jgi:hypothetical protein